MHLQTLSTPEKSCRLNRSMRHRLVQIFPKGVVLKLDYNALRSRIARKSNGGSGMKTFEVRLRFQDRSQGMVESTMNVDASSLPGAVAKAARAFVKGLDRKQRFDMNKNGLEMTTKSVEKPTESQGQPQQASTD